ncbi:hypothetical protein ACE6H2_008952 [Prunus campanulata]
MTSLTLPLPPTLISTPASTVKPQLALSFLRQSHPFPRFSHYRLPKPPPPKTITASFAYVSGPASDPIVSEPDPKIDGPDSKDQPPSVISWGLLLSLLLKHKLRLAISAFALIGCSACTLSMPIFSGRFFEVLIGKRPEPLWKLLSKVGVLYALEPILTIVFVVNLNTIWEKVMSTLRAQIFGRVLIQKVGELTGLLTSDLGSIKSVVSENISRDRGFRALTEASNSTPSTTVYKRSTVPVFKAHGLAQASISDCVTETFSAIRTGELSVGTVASFIGYTFTLTFAVQGLVNTFGDLRGTFAAVERINSVLSGIEIDESLAYGLEREMQQKKLLDENYRLFLIDGSSEKNQSVNTHYMSALKSASNISRLAWSGDVCLQDVHFSYPLRPDVEILNGLNLTLKCGTVTALVGPSGAGKSTIVQLLARFYEPNSGRLTVAGEDVRTFDKSEWARIVSLVNQEPVLFSVSVGENIAYGLPDDHVSKDDVIKAAKAANAHEFIISLPQGYDTLVGERGGLLSGGQRQATSALDAISERLVQDALNHLMKRRTTLVIAHRLSTVQNAHQIALCSDGRIAELGTHSELLAKKGQYASLVGTQRLAFE